MAVKKRNGVNSLINPGSEIIERMLKIYCCGDGEILRQVRASGDFIGLVTEFCQVAQEIFSA
ncbi:MAG: hypothetical protein ACOX8W_08560 [bacterium]|jgi:hypothetical protein